MKKEFILICCLVVGIMNGCANEVEEKMVSSSQEETLTREKEEALTFELPEGYHYEKIKIGFLEYLNYEAWFHPSEQPQTEHEIIYEIYRPEKKEGMQDVVNRIWMKCSTEQGDRWYSCDALTNGKWRNQAEEYRFDMKKPLDTDGALVCLGTDKALVPTVMKPSFMEDETEKKLKEEIFEDLKEDLKLVYEELLAAGEEKELKLQLFVADFSVSKGFMPYACLLVNEDEVFLCQFEVGSDKGKGYADYWQAFQTNYSVDWERSMQYATGSVEVFDGNQIFELAAVDRAKLEHIKEAAVFQYCYTGK